MKEAAQAALRRAECALAPYGWPEEGKTLSDVLTARALTWVTVPRPVQPAKAAACRKAIAWADEALVHEPGSALAYLLRAAARMWLKDDEGFFDDLKAAEKRGPNLPLVLRWKACHALKNNDADGALKAARRAVALEPTAWAYALRAEALLRGGKAKDALEDADRSLELEPRRCWALVLQSEGRRDLRRYDHALESLNRLVALHPRPWSYAIRGRTAFNFRDKRAGMKDLNRALALDRCFWEGYAYRGEALRRLGKRAAALRDLDRALRAAPNSPARIYSWRGAVLLEEGRFEEAARDLTPVIETEAENLISWALSQRARAFLGLEKFREAVADMNRAVRVDPKHGWIYGLAGRAGNTLGRAKQIVDQFTEAIRREPSWPWGHAWRGETRMRAGSFEEAITDLDEALRLVPEEAWFWAWRGLAREGLGDADRARADFEKAIALDPKYPAVYGWRAQSAMKAGRPAEAREFLDRFIALDRRSSWAYAWRGECRLKCGDPVGARGDLEDAVNLETVYGDAWAWLAEARRQLGDSVGALEAAQRAVALDGDKALAHLARGLAFGAVGRAKEQIADFRIAVGLRPEQLSAQAAALGLSDALKSL